MFIAFLSCPSFTRWHSYPTKQIHDTHCIRLHSASRQFLKTGAWATVTIDSNSQEAFAQNPLYTTDTMPAFMLHPISGAINACAAL